MNFNEEVYKESSVEKNNRKIAFKIFIVGLIVSLVLCGIGLVKQNNARKINEENARQAQEQSQIKIDNAMERIEEIDKELAILNKQYEEKKDAESDSFGKDLDFSDMFSGYKNSSDAFEISYKIGKLEIEKNQLENDDYAVYYFLVEPIKYMIFYYIAGGVFGASVLISLIYFLATRRKK